MTGDNTSTNERFTSLNDYIKSTYGSTLSANPSGKDEALSLVGSSQNGAGDEYTASSGSVGESNGDNVKWSLRRLALELSLWANIFITITKLAAYIRTL